MRIRKRRPVPFPCLAEDGKTRQQRLLQPLLRRQARERGKLLTTAHLRHHLLQHSMRIDAMRKAMACNALRDGGGQQCVIFGHELHHARKIVMRQHALLARSLGAHA